MNLRGKGQVPTVLSHSWPSENHLEESFILRSDFGDIHTVTSAKSGRPFYPSSAPPESGPVCDPPLSLAPPPQMLPPDVPGTVAASFPVGAVVAPRLITEVPGLAARSLGYSRLLKKIYSTSCCIGLGAPPRLGDIDVPSRLSLPSVAPMLPPSIPACAHLTVGI